MCTPALRVLRNQYPDARISVAGRGAVCSLLDGLPFIDEFYPIDGRLSLWGMLKWARPLRRQAFDIAIIFPHSFRAALLSRFTGAKSHIGYARGGRSCLLTEAIAPYSVDGVVTPQYMATEYLALVEVLGCQDDGEGLELSAKPDSQRKVDEFISGEGPLIGIAPGAAFGPSKCWPAERYARTLELIAKQVQPCRFVVLTGPGEEATRATVMERCSVPLLECDGGNPSLDTLKAAISRVDLLLCNDSGPRHVAIAFKKPVVCVMGSTSPTYTDSAYEKGEVIRIDVDCGPCQKPVCTTDHRCMTGISPEQVAQTIIRLIG